MSEHDEGTETKEMHWTNSVANFVTNDKRFILITVCFATLIWTVLYVVSHKIEIPIKVKIFLAAIAILSSIAVVVSGPVKQKIKDELEKLTEKTDDSSNLESYYYFWRLVPANHVWVLRNAWSSEAQSGRGYTVKAEGIRFFLPGIWHKEVLLISLVHSNRDPEPVQVNTIDEMLPNIDYRIKTWVAHHEIDGKNVDMAAVKFATRLKKDERTSTEDQWAHVSLNHATSKFTCSGKLYDEDAFDKETLEKELARKDKVCTRRTVEKEQKIHIQGLTQLSDKELPKLGRAATKKFNEEMAHFGIQGEIAIQKIRPPESIEKASAGQRAADSRGKGIRSIIDKTGANANLVMAAETFMRWTEMERGKEPKKSDLEIMSGIISKTKDNKEDDKKKK